MLLLAQFLTSGDGKLVKYFLSLFELYAALCRGYSSSCQNAVAKLISRATVCAILVMPTTVPRISFVKSFVMRIAVELYLKTELHFQRIRPSYFLIIKNSVVMSKFEHSLTEEHQDFHRKLRGAGLAILKENTSQCYDDPETNELLTVTLTMFVIFLSEGLISEEEQAEIITVLLQMADSATDVPTRFGEPPFDDNFNRCALSEHSRVLFDTKIALVEVLRVCFQLRLAA